MNKVSVTTQELQDLAKKLDGMQLTDNEKAIMLGLFGAAGGAIEQARNSKDAAQERNAAGPRSPVPAVLIHRGPTLPPLSQGFKEAFKRGEVGQFVIGGDTDSGPLQSSISVEVGATCVSVGWSKDVTF